MTSGARRARGRSGCWIDSMCSTSTTARTDGNCGALHLVHRRRRPFIRQASECAVGAIARDGPSDHKMSARASPLPSRSNQQEHRSLAFLRQFRSRGNLVQRRTEFLHMSDRESGSDEKVEGRSHRAMLLHNPFGKPIGRPHSFHKVMVKGPRLATLRVNRPAWIGRSHVDRVFRREHEVSVWNHCPVYRPEQPCGVADVMQGK